MSKNEDDIVYLVEDTNQPILVEEQSSAMLVEDDSTAMLVEETSLQPKRPKSKVAASSKAAKVNSSKETQSPAAVDKDLRKRIEQGFARDFEQKKSWPKGDYCIPEGIKKIGPRAFMRSVNLTSVTIPNTVTSIGKRAFYCCTNLSVVEIPESVTKIDDEAFYLCRKLEQIIVPKGKIMAFRKMCPRDSGRPPKAQIVEKLSAEDTQKKAIEIATRKKIEEAQKREQEAMRRVKEAERKARRC